MRRQKISRRRFHKPGRTLKRILHGIDEPIFTVLPQSVLSNVRYPDSENALLWNLIYPLAQPTLNLADLLRIRPLWGTAWPDSIPEDDLWPYFWGYSVAGERMPFLDQVLDMVDSNGPQTEIDLLLLGRDNLVVVEVKNLSRLGRCSRYSKRRCPEIHEQDQAVRAACRYWEVEQARFDCLLDFGERPESGENSPPCNRHYQLGRTMLVGWKLAQQMQLDFHLWFVLPRTNWASLERTWLDFTDRVRDDLLWRRLRVMAWEDIRSSSTF